MITETKQWMWAELGGGWYSSAVVTIKWDKPWFECVAVQNKFIPYTNLCNFIFGLQRYLNLIFGYKVLILWSLVIKST